jgi:hypothetical protein
VTDPREMAFRDVRREDPARFLRELRELRNHAGLGHAELAARAHYPCDAIKAAEAGPTLPDLPVLSAYVRGCGGTLADWEERWRAVTGCPASPLLATRETGCSEAADAGARVGAVSAFSAFAAVSADSDGQDTDRVMAALHRVADGRTAAGAAAVLPSSHLEEYVAPGPAREATDAAKVAADVWTPATPAADGALTAAPPATADSELTAVPLALADTELTAALSTAEDTELKAGLSAVAGGELKTPASASADSERMAAASATADSELKAAAAATADSAAEAAPPAAADGAAAVAPLTATPLAAAPPAVARGERAAVATAQARRSRGPLSSRRALAAVAVVVLLLVAILLAVFG